MTLRVDNFTEGVCRLSIAVHTPVAPAALDVVLRRPSPSFAVRITRVPRVRTRTRAPRRAFPARPAGRDSFAPVPEGPVPLREGPVSA
ncbi:hypothetical protein GCM10018785_34470 [Streptomyces longispororuber]|uniref:Uncharacterized protein n=1 Tax=Streptomyces longispororuber TaxID=68230 RepID=A0A918ZP15_9ACTN|nr:hypothetical protein GCM10018785_34470 [Streptomyces longispororuber]